MAIVADNTSQQLLDNINNKNSKTVAPVQQQTQKPAPPVTSVTKPIAGNANGGSLSSDERLAQNAGNIHREYDTKPNTPLTAPSLPTGTERADQMLAQKGGDVLRGNYPVTSNNTDNEEQTKPATTYQDIITRTSPYKPMTDEEVAAQRRKQKREMLFAALGDGISSIANLVATTKGAPSAYNPEQGLTKRLQDRYDKMKAERKAEDAEYYEQMIKAMGMDAEQENKNRDYLLKQYSQAYKQARDEIKDNQWKDKFDTDNDHWQKNYDQNEDHFTKSNEVAVEGKKETKRHNMVVEGQGKTRLGLESARLGLEGERVDIARENAGNNAGNGGPKKGQYSIRLNDGTTHYYNKSLSGAVTRLAPKMVAKARAASERYDKLGNSSLQRHYRDLADGIEKAKSQNAVLNYVTENIADFPSLDGEIRNIIGAGITRPTRPQKKPATASQNNAGSGFNVNSYARGKQTKQSNTSTTKKKPTDFQ